MLAKPSDFPREPKVPRNRIGFGSFGVLPFKISLKMTATCSPCWPANWALGECSLEALSPTT